jgi:starch-binding outer membrane protein, SusD/RagB family
MIKKLYCLITFLSWSFLIAIVSCKKFVEIDPPRTDLIKSTVFTSDATANAAVLDIFYGMMRSGFASGASRSISLLASYSSDEQIEYSVGGNFTTEYYKNSLTPKNDANNSSWNTLYSWIYKANAILEGLESSSGITEKLKKQLEGEAKFIRAFCHFYLVNLWGDVPLVLTTNYQLNSTAGRTPAVRVNEQIINDLKDARELLVDDYSYSNNERTRPNKWTATALLARVYLYTEDWINAENESTGIIDNSSTYSIVPALTEVFYRNSPEAIWQFQSSPSANNFPNDILTFYAFSAPPTWGSLRPELVNDFESGDLRKTNWIKSIDGGGNTYFFAAKYQSFTPLKEYSTIFRLAEQYLIRAEARAQQNNITAAQADINFIRNRANLGNTTANDKASLLTAIEKERRFELFTEWGHRWLDLKRWNKADAVLQSLKAPDWQPNDVFYPIPEYQVLNSPVDQNPGY